MTVPRPSSGRTISDRATRRATDAGFTLVEMCWAMAIFFVLAGIAVTSLQGWNAAERQGSTTSELQALMREVQQRAVTEGRTMCVDFDLSAQTWSVLRGVCGTPGQVHLQGPMRPEGGIRIESATFATGGGSTIDGVTFLPRGTATPGTLTIVRGDSDRVDTLAIEGLTGRVSRV